MKIGIVTVFDSSNIGSYLQALGIQKIILEHGDEPYFIETRDKFTVFLIHMGWYNLKNINSIRSLIRVIREIISSFPEVKKRFVRYKNYKKDWKALNNRINVKKSNNLNLDVLLLGSDEIWNLKQHSLQSPYMYGIGLKAKKKIAYAVSVGDMDENILKQFPKYINAISHLDEIFVRDSYTEQTLRKYNISISGKLCDPTLQTDIRPEMKKNINLNEDSSYFMIYAYSVSDKMKEYIKKFSSENKLKIVAVSLPHSWCDIYINCSPLEFGAVLAKASYVYTSTFHGTIFSTLYHTQFIVNPVNYKIRDLVGLLGIKMFTTDNCKSYSEFCDILLLDRDYCHIENEILKLHNESSVIYMDKIKI